ARRQLQEPGLASGVMDGQIAPQPMKLIRLEIGVGYREQLLADPRVPEAHRAVPAMAQQQVAARSEGQFNAVRLMSLTDRAGLWGMVQVPDVDHITAGDRQNPAVGPPGKGPRCKGVPQLHRSLVRF